MEERPEPGSELPMGEGAPALGRRRFLTGLAAAATTPVATTRLARAQCTTYTAGDPAAMRLGDVAELLTDEVRSFEYPAGHPCLLVRLRAPAVGGVGPQQTIVAFSAICPHRGLELSEIEFLPEHGALGPCPWHDSAFDLKTGGSQIIGQACRRLPQVVLEDRSGELFAVGLSHAPLGLMTGLTTTGTA